MEKDFETYGEHIKADLWGVDPFLLNNLPYLKQLCKFAVAKSNATFVGLLEKQFIPDGVTILILLEESHLSLHSYPSKGFVALDCYTCGQQCKPGDAIGYLIENLKPDPNRIYIRTTIRGVE